MTSRPKNLTAGSNARKRERQPTIAAGFARGLVELAVAKGADRSLLLERSRLSVEDLEDQDNRIPLERFVALMRAGKRLANDPALALHFGEAFDLSALSIVGLIAANCSDGADGFLQINRYARLVAEVDLGSKDRYRLERRGNELWMIDQRQNPNDFPELTESTWARAAGMARRCSPRIDYLKAVHFTHAEPEYRSEYDRIFRVPLRFDCDENALITTGEWLQYKPVPASRYVFGILSSHAQALLERLETKKSTRARVEALLMSVLHTGDADIKSIAASMAVSRQTLFRRLKDEGVTFARVLDELRHKLALYYLNGKKVSVNETAYLVGFSEPAAFSRAFKRWTGLSPRHFAARSRSRSI